MHNWKDGLVVYRPVYRPVVSCDPRKVMCKGMLHDRPVKSQLTKKAVDCVTDLIMQNKTRGQYCWT